jgi:hypothetical protein
VDIAELIQSPWWTAAKDIGVAVASLIGGAWVLFRFVGERRLQAALDIGIEYAAQPLTTLHRGSYIVHFDVTLTNPGRTRLRAKWSRCRGLAFDDLEEKHRHSCSLQIKEISIPGCVGATEINWFTGPHLRDTELSEMNLLTEYEDPKRCNRVDFWMEPQERYHLGRTVILPAGHYLAKVTFIGSRGRDNFWSQVQYIPIPKPPRPAAADTDLALVGAVSQQQAGPQ